MSSVSQHHSLSGRRPAAVNGYFYPGDAGELAALVEKLLTPPAQGKTPKAIIVPHAGYIYSGAVAASGYSHLAGLDKRISRVVLLGPAHRVYVQGLAASSAGEFASPLGTIPVDNESIDRLLELPQVRFNDAAHEYEHSLEVHLPFLQRLFSHFKLVPMLVGEADPETVADALDLIWGSDETLIVISTDLSHFHDYDTARAIDEETARAIENLSSQIGPEQACGCKPLNGLLTLARRKKLQIINYDLKNSGDTAGDRQRVVGYGAWGLY
jgi:hypothetical protein